MTNDQLTLFPRVGRDHSGAIAARDQAIENVAGGAAPMFMQHAEVMARALARSHLPFTTDDLWDVVDAPREPRAMGAVITRLARAGVIRKTGRYVQSSRRANHARPLCEWVG